MIAALAENIINSFNSEATEEANELLKSSFGTCCAFSHTYDEVLVSSNMLKASTAVTFAIHNQFLPQDAMDGNLVVIPDAHRHHEIPAMLRTNPPANTDENGTTTTTALSMFLVPILVPEGLAESSTRDYTRQRVLGCLLLTSNCTDSQTITTTLKNAFLLSQSLSTNHHTTLTDLTTAVFSQLYPTQHRLWGPLANMLYDEANAADTEEYNNDLNYSRIGHSNEDRLAAAQEAFVSTLLESCHPLTLRFQQPSLESEFWRWRRRASSSDDAIKSILLAVASAQLLLVVLKGDGHLHANNYLKQYNLGDTNGYIIGSNATLLPPGFSGVQTTGDALRTIVRLGGGVFLCLLALPPKKPWYVLYTKLILTFVTAMMMCQYIIPAALGSTISSNVVASAQNAVARSIVGQHLTGISTFLGVSIHSAVVMTFVTASLLALIRVPLVIHGSLLVAGELVSYLYTNEAGFFHGFIQTYDVYLHDIRGKLAVHCVLLGVMLYTREYTARRLFACVKSSD